MIKVKLLTETTPERLEEEITHWTNDGWRLYEGIVIIASKDIWTVVNGQTVVNRHACSFLQIMTRPEGTCKAS